MKEGNAAPFGEQANISASWRAATAEEGAAAAAPTTASSHWTVNGDFISLRATGVARYAREVVLAIDQLVADAHPSAKGLALEVVAPCEPAADFRLKAIPLRVVPEFCRPRLPQFWVQVQLPFQVNGGLVSLCNLAPVAVRKQIVCIHDLHTSLMPDSYGRLFRWAHRLILPQLGRRAAAITTVSEFSRVKLVESGVAAGNKIVVTYNGADHAERWTASRSSLELGAFRPFVLCLGQSQKYKNVELLLKIASELDRLGLDLCMAGDVDRAMLERVVPQMPSNLRLLGRVSDDDLASALTRALCFLFPSRMEGFGLPAVEAMALGCPLVASSAPCLPEICGEAALYAHPDDADGWIDAIRRVRDDQELRTSMIRNGRARAARYSWRAIAQTYLCLIAQIDGGSAPASGAA